MPHRPLTEIAAEITIDWVRYSGANGTKFRKPAAAQAAEELVTPLTELAAKAD
jgi:hypothetical protein